MTLWYQDPAYPIADLTTGISTTLLIDCTFTGDTGPFEGLKTEDEVTWSVGAIVAQIRPDSNKNNGSRDDLKVNSDDAFANRDKIEVMTCRIWNGSSIECN